MILTLLRARGRRRGAGVRGLHDSRSGVGVDLVEGRTWITTVSKAESCEMRSDKI
jgi:hypothetical protein